MKTLLLIFALVCLVSPSIAELRFTMDVIGDIAKFPIDAIGGATDMARAYYDLQKSNHIGADKYFHAKGNFEAANRGPGGEWAAEVISDGREFYQEVKQDYISGPRDSIYGRQDSIIGKEAAKQDSIEDQEANRWGRNGGDPNKYRPKGLPDKY